MLDNNPEFDYSSPDFGGLSVDDILKLVQATDDNKIPADGKTRDQNTTERLEELRKAALDEKIRNAGDLTQPEGKAISTYLEELALVGASRDELSYALSQFVNSDQSQRAGEPTILNRLNLISKGYRNSVVASKRLMSQPEELSSERQALHKQAIATNIKGWASVNKQIHTLKQPRVVQPQ